MKYHVEVDATFWPKNFPEWDRLPKTEQDKKVNDWLENLQHFLKREVPKDIVHIVFSETGMMSIAPEGPVHVKPLP